MTGLVSLIVFIAIVVLVCIIVWWAVSTLLAQLPGLPAGVIVVLQVIIVLVALLVILQRVLPYAGIG